MYTVQAAGSYWAWFSIKNNQSREYLRIYRGPGFLAVLVFAPPSPVRKLGRRHTGRLSKRRETTCWRESGAEGVRGAKSFDDEKARSSISHSILSEPEPHACDMCPIVYCTRTIVRSSFITIMKLYQTLYLSCKDHYSVKNIFYLVFNNCLLRKVAWDCFVLVNIEKCIEKETKTKESLYRKWWTNYSNFIDTKQMSPFKNFDL